MIELSGLYERFARIGVFMDRLKERASWKRSLILPSTGEKTTNPAA